MAVPKTTKVFEESMDPYDVVDFEVNVAPLLETNEGVDTYTLSIPTESSLFGLEIKNTGGYSTTITNNVIRFYLGIALSEQVNAAFYEGVILPIEISVTTNSLPPRKKQRTVAVKVVER